MNGALHMHWANHSQAFYFSSHSGDWHFDRQLAPHLYSWKSYKYGMQGAKFPFLHSHSRCIWHHGKNEAYYLGWRKPTIHKHHYGSNTTTTTQEIAPSTSQTGTDVGATISKAIIYERALNKVAKDVEVLLLKSDGKQDIATLPVYSMFEVMRTRGLEVDNANPEIIINAIEDVTMKKFM